MKIKDVMTTPVITITPDTPYKDIVETLAEHAISGVPVTEDGQLIGIVSDGDLLAKEAYGTKRRHGFAALLSDALAGREASFVHKARGVVARDIMSGRVITAAPDEDVRRAAARMIELGVKRLPVVEDGTIVGIVSRGDVLRVFGRSDDHLAAAIDRLLHQCLFVPPDDEITVSAEHGIVTLQGFVLSEASVSIVEAIVRAADGVVDVENRLAFREASGT